MTVPPPASTPTVSIGLPVFNGAARIPLAVDSILNQDFTDFEVVICDNASTDDTATICRAYARRDQRVRYFRNETNIGVNPNHDRVFELARGEYFAWSADDVEYLPGMLRRCLEVIKAAPTSVSLVYPLCQIWRDGRIAGGDGSRSIECRDHRPYRRLESVVRRVYLVNQLFGLAKREVMARTHLNGPYTSSDYVLLAELAMLGEIRELSETLIRRRIDSDRGTEAHARNQHDWKTWSGAGRRNFKDYLSNRERLALEYFWAVVRSPIGPTHKLPCLLRVLPVYYSRQWPAIADFWLKKGRAWKRKLGSLSRIG
ncbi:glycosyltransferase [bacterium]|nr:glycosyltransferase [bacterium]